MLLFKKSERDRKNKEKLSKETQSKKLRKAGRRENMPTARQNISQMKRKSTLCRISCIFYIIIYIVKIF